jgi:NADH-quinone oxidoreductase subunit C
MADDLESVVARLRELAGDAPVAWEQPRPNRVYLTVRPADVREIGRRLFEDLGARFATATGLDTGRELEVVYHFPHDAVGLVVNLRVRTPKSDGTLPSLTPVVPAAEWIEREMADLVGIRFEGHPRPERLILSDDWPEGVYPLRQEFREEFRDD